MLRCCVHRTSLCTGMCLLVDDLLGQLHQLLGKIHVVRLRATFLGDLRRCDYQEMLVSFLTQAGYERDLLYKPLSMHAVAAYIELTQPSNWLLRNGFNPKLIPYPSNGYGS